MYNILPLFMVFLFNYSALVTDLVYLFKLLLWRLNVEHNSITLARCSKKFDLSNNSSTFSHVIRCPEISNAILNCNVKLLLMF